MLLERPSKFLTIYKNRLILFLLFFMSLDLAAYTYMGSAISAISNVMRVLSVLGALWMMLRKKRTLKFSPMSIWLLGIELAILLSTILNGGEIRDCILSILSFLAMALIYETWSDNMEDLVFTLMPLMELLVYANFITVLMFPDGMFLWETDYGWNTNLCWLLGYRTGTILYLLPACMVAFLYRQYGGSRLREFTIYLVSFITIAFTPARCATSTLTLLLYFAMLFMVRRGFKFNVVALAVLYVFLFFAVVIFRIQYIFLKPFAEILGKDVVTMTGRTVLWDRLYLAVAAKPIFGYGTLAPEISTKILVRGYGTNGHNIFLDYLFKGGIVTTGIFSGMLIYLCSKLRSSQNKLITQGIIVAFFAFMFNGLVEALQSPFMMCLLYYFVYFSTKMTDTAAMRDVNRRIWRDNRIKDI